jgi:tetratricopeptide (TPR) repeat protein
MAIQIWQAGDKIKNDRFEILKQLGKGGFGITYLAEDTVKKQQIVIKTLNANQQGEADFAQKQENFVKEGFTLKTFNHPHIVKVYEPIQIGELWGLVMEYIPGQDLADYIIANGRLGEAEALLYIDQIAQALNCVHQQKFFHRDVKPHNIMLRQDRGEAVLIDFGIAKEFVDLQTIYLSNSLGTELYKPIEQYEKRGQFGAYTDIYALTVTLYHLLTGAAPGGGSPLYTSKARKDAQDKGWGDKLDEYLWGELAKAGISGRTQAAIKVGMAIEPSQRPQNMTEFRKLLGLVRRNISIEAEIKSNSDCDERDPDTWCNLGLELYNLGNYEDAIIMYDFALVLGRDRDYIWCNHGLALAHLGRYKEAIHSYDFALECCEHRNPIVWYNRGNVLSELGEYEVAIANYDRALEFERGDPDIWCSRGMAMIEIERYKEAISNYNSALRIKRDNPVAWFYRGIALNNSDRYEEAVASYDRALKIEPDNDDVWYCRGNTLYNLGRYKEALSSYDRALELEPDCNYTWTKHGYTLFELGRYKEALSSYERALELEPDCDYT